LFPDDQMERLRSFPDIGTDELIRFCTLTAADAAFVDPGRGRGPADRLGLAVQLCTLPWLGVCGRLWPEMYADARRSMIGRRWSMPCAPR
jgi:hypothetical protein